MMKYFKKLVGEKVYLSPRRVEDAEQYASGLMILKQQTIQEEVEKL